MAAIDPSRPLRTASRLRLYVVLLPAHGGRRGGRGRLYCSSSRARSSTSLNAQHAGRPGAWLFFGAAAGGRLGALAGLVVGLRVAGRIRGIASAAEALTARVAGVRARQEGTDEIGALDAAVGRLTLSVDRSSATATS